MVSTLKYGSGKTLELELSPGVLVGEFASPLANGDGTHDSLAQAIGAPLDFPPLRKATVPGDHVVLALGAAVPQAAEVVAAIVPELLAGGVAAGDITVLRGSAASTSELDPRSALPSGVRDEVQVVMHDPAHQEELSFLAADSQGEPLYLNRRLCEADLVIPIGCLRPDDISDDAGGTWNDTLYPTFADRKIIEHFTLNGVPLTAGQLAHRQRQVDQVSWLLGIQVTAQVVPAGGGQMLRTLAGSPPSVFDQGRKLCRMAWERQLSKRASLVIAGIGGGASQQTWENVGRGLQAALQLVSDGGGVVLCSEVASKPGPALKVLAAADEPEAALARLRKVHSSDVLLARLLVESRERVTVFLLSNVDEDIVMPLGFAYISNPQEIGRLAAHHDSCTLLPDAQYAQPIVAGEKPVS